MVNKTTREENYFSWYGMDETLAPDGAILKKMYYAKSLLHHPDKAGDENLEQAVDLAAYNNAAYKTLKNKDATLGYIIEMYKPADAAVARLSPQFLMEMMELNECVDDGPIAQAKQMHQDALDAWDCEFGALATQFEAGDRSEKLIGAMEEAMLRKKYLARLGERL